MLAFPRFSDMFEMKRPQFMGNYFDDDDEEWFRPMGQQSTQQQKQRRVPVQVQHEPALQHHHQPHQMPQPSVAHPQSRQSVPVSPSSDVQQPQFSGVPQSHRFMPAQPSSDLQQPAAQPNSQVRNPIQIPVQHLSSTDHWTPEGDIAPPLYSQKERSVPVVVQSVPFEKEIPIKAVSPTQRNVKRITDPDIMETRVLQELPNPEPRSKPPSVRKQTSLIVSEDHTTPIPLSYEPMVIEEAIEEEDGGGFPEATCEAKYPTVKKQTSLMVSDDHPTVKKQTSLMVSDDHTTPIPMPCEQLILEVPFDESVVDGEQNDSTKLESPKNPLKQDFKNPLDSQIDNHGRKCSEQLSPVEDVTSKVISSSKLRNDTQKEEDSAFREQKPILSKEPSFEMRNIPITVHGVKRSPPAKLRQDTMPARGETMISKPPVGMPQMPQPQPTGIGPSEAPKPNDSFTKPGDTYTQPKPPGPKPKDHWVDPRVESALDTIQKISEEAYSLGSRVDVLQVESKDRTYLSIEEHLTKLLLKLDSIDALGNDDVRSQRKSCIKKVQQTLDALELKLIGS